MALLALLVSTFPSITPDEFLERSGSKKKKKKKDRRAKLKQIWAVCKSFGVRDKQTSLHRADLHRCFGFPWLELGSLHTSNNNPLWLSFLSGSCLAGQTRNFNGNLCTPGCIDIWHFPGTECTIQPALSWTQWDYCCIFLSLPSMCGCLIWKDSCYSVWLRRYEQFPALSLTPSYIPPPCPHTNK